MKIVFSTDQIYLHGGLEKVMAQKANYFVNTLGYEVFIVTTQQNNRPACYSLDKKIKLIDINIPYSRSKSYFHITNILKIPNHFSRALKVVKDINPDVIIICNFAFDFYWTPFIQLKALKFKEYHSSGYFASFDRKNNNSFLRKIIYRINDFFESKYDKLLLLNPDEKIYYKSNNLSVIPNPIALEVKQKAKLENKKAIAAGRIAPIKGFENLIKAWAIVAQENPTWQLHIYGQGEKSYIEELQSQINELNLSEIIQFKEATTDLLEIMTHYSFYVMSSLSECFPMVLLESLSVGLPILSFDCPTGPRNIVTDNEDGMLVTNGNINELANKILYLTNHKEIRTKMGEKALENIKRFDLVVVMQQWNELVLNTRKK